MWSSGFASRNTHSVDTELGAVGLTTADRSVVMTMLVRLCVVQNSSIVCVCVCVCVCVVVVVGRFYHYSAILRSRAVTALACDLE